MFISCGQSNAGFRDPIRRAATAPSFPVSSNVTPAQPARRASSNPSPPRAEKFALTESQKEIAQLLNYADGGITTTTENNENIPGATATSPTARATSTFPMIPSRHVYPSPTDAPTPTHISNLTPNHKRPAAELDVAADTPPSGADYLARIASLEFEARSRQAKIEDLSLRLTTTMHDLERQRMERDAYGRTVKETAAMMVDLERQLDESQRAKEKTETAKEDVERELGKARGELLTKDVKISELREVAVARERMIEEMEGKLTQLVAMRVPAEELEAERRERKKVEKELEEVQALLTECRECMEQAVALEDAGKDTGSGNKGGGDHEGKVNELEARLAEKEAELEEMQERVIEAEFDLAEAGILKKKHDELQKAFEDVMGENEVDKHHRSKHHRSKHRGLRPINLVVGPKINENFSYSNSIQFVLCMQSREAQTDFSLEIRGTSIPSTRPLSSDEGCQTDMQLEQILRESKEAIANFKLMSAANEIMYQQMIQNREKYDVALRDQITTAEDADSHWSNLLEQALSVREQTMECLNRTVLKNQDMEQRLAQAKEMTNELKERVKQLEWERDEFVARVDAMYEGVLGTEWAGDDQQMMVVESGHEDEEDAMEGELDDGEGGGFCGEEE
ncbi:hypothetical protein BC937DRAFT_87924 [Endogone sp. FLAS-F59071]|nr:hypothetical protein BC937DRAFT_87924 [Endogone sp. FLAS-F59071]|eukprot:RUS19151.1 hypothetical protein BC937DRAFT_87924 [Endogone sp. FLAS-F59071]